MPVALLIGVGENVGRATVAKFAAAGYKVAIASRTERFDSSKYPFFKFDAADSTKVPELFSRVHKEVGVPSVVLYNAYAGAPKTPGSVLDIDTVEGFQQRLNANTVSPVIAADEAVKGFLKLEAEGKLGPEGATYLFTGNGLNEKAYPGFFNLGIGKTATAYMIDSLANTTLNDKPFSFYYIDERDKTGRPMTAGVNADLHADVFLELARDPKQGPWMYTFSRETGYKVFSKDWTLE
ncbi:NAD(P)-binding protein [Poronia punctata]|nr:NAD(P)-binding protein [Poronia punctata]